MTAFEKWWKNQMGKYPLVYGTVKTSAKDAWKAALGWALSMMDKDKEQGWPINASKCTIREEIGLVNDRQPKPLAQFLAEYNLADCIDRELIEQALKAYQSAENVVIKIEQGL